MTEWLARISARRAIAVIAIWGVLVVAGGILADDGGLGLNFGFVDVLDNATTTELTLGGGAESSQADALLEELRGPKPNTEIVIVRSNSFTVDDPEFRSKVEALDAQFRTLGAETVTTIEHYFTPDVLLSMLTPGQLDQLESIVADSFGQELQEMEPDALLPLVLPLLNAEQLERVQQAAAQVVSADRRTTIMRLTLAGDFDQALENVETVLDIVHEADNEAGFRVLIVGDASIAHEQNELAEADLRQGERIGLPVALIILIVLFGTLVAAFVPIGLSIVCVLVALGITALIGQAFDLIFFVTLMIIMIGLAVGIDYSLVIISRFRTNWTGVWMCRPPSSERGRLQAAPSCSAA